MCGQFIIITNACQMECLPKEQLFKIRFVDGNIIKIIDLIY